MKIKRLFTLGVLLIAPCVVCASVDDLFFSTGLVPQNAGDMRQNPLSKELPNSKGKSLPALDSILTLDDCVKIALANSPDAISAALSMQEAKVNLNIAKAAFLPTAKVGASQEYDIFKTAGTPRTNGGNSDVYAQATLSISGVSDLIRSVKINKLSLEQAEYDITKVQNTIYRDVRKAYYALLSAKHAVDIRTKSRDLYKDQYERVDEYFKLGLRPKVDVTTAEVNLNNEELSLIRAKNLVKTTSASLANVMGVTAPFILNIQDISIVEEADISFEDAINTAYTNRPDVLSDIKALKISQIKVNQAKAAFFPTLSFSAGYTKNGENFYLDNDETKLMASIDFPIFNAFSTYNNYKKKKISFEKTLNESRGLHNTVFLEVQSAYIALQEAKESIPIAKLTVDKAKENLDLSTGRYNEGISDIIELKDAEVSYTDAELNLLTAQYDYATALANLKQAMGIR